MKINRLSIAGFGPYRTEQTVDFDAFDGDGIFLISGKTGAGKSSILDAICFALYGSVPRYDKTTARLRSDHCAPDDVTRVALEFTVSSSLYRIVRTPEYERLKARGTGTTKAAATAELFIWNHDDWRGVATRTVDVGNELAEIVGLKKDEFLQVILLAQNRFQEFLLAKSEQRGDVLRRLFDTGRFDTYERTVVERAKTLEHELSQSTAVIGEIEAQAARMLPSHAAEHRGTRGGNWMNAGLTAAIATHDGAQVEAARADTRAREAAHDLEAQKALARSIERRRTATAQLEELHAVQHEIERAQHELDAAERADSVVPFTSARDRGRAAADEAAERVEAAFAELARVDSTEAHAQRERARLSARIDELVAHHGALESALGDEERRPTFERNLDQRATLLATADDSIAALTARLSELPALLTANTDATTSARIDASAHEATLALVEQLERARAAALEASAVDARLTHAHETEVTAGKHRTATSSALDAARERRLLGHAAELAAELSDGAPCTVCGSAEHPAPAVSDTKPVTQADIDTAQALLAEAETAATTASTAVTTLTTQLNELRLAAAGKSVETIDDELTEAKVARKRASTAQRTVERLTAERQKLLAEHTTADAEMATARTARDNAATAHTEAKQSLATATERIEHARGDHDTVVGRVAQLTEQLTANRAALGAIDASAQHRAELARAEVALSEQLAAHAFEDESDATAARLDTTAQAERLARTRTHADGLAAARATLIEPELQDLPETTPALDDTTKVATSTSNARDAAFADEQRLRTEVAHLRGFVERRDEALDDSTTTRAEYDVMQRLAATLAGADPNTKRMRLESFVLAAELEQIVTAANVRLRTMTSGRYLLEHSDALAKNNARSGLGLQILDQHTGQSRPTHSLSGGETFLASLALALGLAEVVTNRAGGITLDTLFIDEGFGSLDADTLEVAMSTLDSLRTGGRTIGLISHVEAMKEQIPAKLDVALTDRGDSIIRQNAV